MGKWAGKTVIGLTGNIGTGKSVVRKMLEHLGAYGIDADALAHRAMAKGAPGYKPIIETFGRWILDKDEQIDRVRLGRLVFNDPAALAQLEKIVHPLVDQAVDYLVRRSPLPVVVIEAIKLLESGLAAQCDSVWVSYAPPEIQRSRLMTNRHMTDEDARMRITAQPSQEEKMARAQVVIRNVSSFDDTWKQVVAGWHKYIKAAEAPAPAVESRPAAAAAPVGELKIQRGRPNHSGVIADLMNRLRPGPKALTSADIMAAFGEKAYLLLLVGDTLMGAMGWQVENLVARATDVILDPAIPPQQAMPLLLKEMEQASRDLQCEASLVFVPSGLASDDPFWKTEGYEKRNPAALGVLAWEEAAKESMPAGTDLLFKQLRQDRVLRPI